LPTDPLHGRRVPSGRRAGAVLAHLFRGMLAAARRQVEGRRPVYLRHFAPELARELMPLLLHEYQLGRHQVQRDVGLRGRVGLGDPGRLRGGLVARHLPDARLRVKAAGPGLTVDLGLFRVEVPAAVQQLVLALAGSVTDTLRDAVRSELAAGLEAGASLATIAGRLAPHFAPPRAYTVAATEASRAMHAGEVEAAAELGVSSHEWLASSDCCTLCASLAGTRAKIGEPFYTHPTGNPAYRVVYHPPAHPHCACALLTVFPEDERGLTRG